MNKETWSVFYSGDINEIEDVEKIAKQVPVEVVVAEGSHILTGKVRMPFIEDAEGNRYFGLPSIETYKNSLISTSSGEELSSDTI